MSTGSAPLGGGYVHWRSYIGQFGSGPTTENPSTRSHLSSSTSQSSVTDDAGSGSDACAAMLCGINVTNLIGASTSGVTATYNSTSGDPESPYWDGYVSATNDKDDAYQFHVPQGYFYEICVEWDGQNWWGFDPNTMIRVFAHGDGSGEYPSSSGFWNTFPHSGASGSICIESYNMAGFGDVSGKTNYFPINDFSGNVNCRPT